MDDLHLRDAFVVDGTGAPGRVADVAVRDGAATLPITLPRQAVSLVVVEW